MSDEPIVKGSWPLVEMRDGRPLWHVAGTNPPEYAPDAHLEALWHEGQTHMAVKAPYYQSDRLAIYNADNLETLRALAAAGERFDLVELDGPYGAGLEGWDILTEDQYLDHYTARLPLVRDVSQPWGVSFLFGYPEGCAEIKAWARQSGTLHLRRWLTWYKQRTAHKGRKCETILVLEQSKPDELFDAFKAELKQRRTTAGMTVKSAIIAAETRHAHRFDNGGRGGGGFLWFEAPSSKLPDPSEYDAIERVFGSMPVHFANLQTVLNGADDLTNIDFISTSYPEDTRELNDAGLRSKPVGLYLDLFRPTVPPRDTKRALILYGGSGNAAIAAGQLGYDVTVCETDPARCEYIRRRWAWKVERRDETPIEELGPMFARLLESEAA